MPPTPPSSASLPGIAFIGFLAVSFVGAIAGATSWEPVGEQPVLDGTLAEAVEDQVDEHAPWREPAITAWAVAEHLLFHEGRPGVLEGDPGWLFSDEELRCYPDEDGVLAQRLVWMEQVRDHLRARGSELMVALLPSKARVRADALGRYQLPGCADARFARTHQGLVELGILAPDLRPVMAAGVAQGEAVFLRTDTHWTPAGAQRVARALAAAQPVAGLADGSWELSWDQPAEHLGDLTRYLPLGPLMDALGPAPDQLSTPRSQGQAGGEPLGLLDEVVVPVALVGSSYSADPRWGFAALLRHALQADVLEAAQVGQGPWLPMRSYLKDDAFLETPPRLVIWEIPERYVTAPIEREGDAPLASLLE